MCYNIFMKIDLTNKKFNRLLVVRQAPHKNNKVMWECLCDCGNTVYVTSHSLIAATTKSCGCYTKDRIKDKNTIHGQAKTKLYSVWKNIRRRCYNTNDKSYNRYGGRGIGVCEEWKDSFQSFYDWAYANGYDNNAKYGECTLDRIDTNGDYCPANCRWVSLKEQANNRQSNVLITYNGKTDTMSNWAREIEIEYTCLFSRIHDLHWSIEKALTTPSRNKRNT